MEPIFDRSGQTVGWFSGDVVRDVQGHAVAFVRGESVYSYQGRHLGELSNGFFRDRAGHAVAFLAKHAFGPLTPLPGLPPLPPLPSIAPLPPLPGLAPIAPMPTLTWSPLSWDHFIYGKMPGGSN